MATTTRAVQGVGRVTGELKRPYVLVFALLGLVTILEVQVPGLGVRFGIAGSTQILLLMASSVAKASLVALYYMHLRYEPRILKLLPVGPLVFVMLLILVLLNP